ncbi:MAG: ornithine carbamoyltransferase [Pseudomonadota bacterium]
MHKNLLSFQLWSSEQAKALLDLAVRIKSAPSEYSNVLSGKTVVALFEKPSLRTRVSFDIGIHKLGGHMVYVDSQNQPMEKREDPIDVGANLSQWTDAVVARVYSHDTLVKLAAGGSIPVINALCDRFHPCQALADYLTLTEADGQLKGKTLAYIGDGNNVTHSLLILGILLGVNQTVVTPVGYEIDANIRSFVENLAEEHGVKLMFSSNIEALRNTDYIYTDTWLSMGDTTPLHQIKDKFMPYQINQALLNKTGTRYVLHCQPAHRDLEITGEVMDGDFSLLMQQAENRLHAQNAILAHLVGKIELDV